jgi:hypothetical protein
LHDNHAVRISYPNIARIIVDWIRDGMPKMEIDFIKQTWNGVDVFQIEN